MQIFKTFNKVSLKLLPSTIAYFIVFVVIAAIMVFSESKNSSSEKFISKKTEIAVLDKDNSPCSKALYNYLDKIHIIKDIDADKESITDEFYNRNIWFVLEIPEGFEEKLLSGNFEDTLKYSSHSDSFSSLLIPNQINSYLKYLDIYIQNGSSIETAITETDKIVALDTKVELHSEPAKSNDEILQFYFQYIPYILTCMIICGLGNVLIAFREKNLNARIQCSATPMSKRNFEMLLGSAFYSTILFLAFIVLAILIFRKDFFTHRAVYYILNAFTYLLFTIGLTYALSFLAKNNMVLNIFSNVFGLAFSFLGGVFVPIEIMTKEVLTFSNFIPTYWYVKANSYAANLGSAQAIPTEFYHCIAIQFLFVAAAFTTGLVASKIMANKA